MRVKLIIVFSLILSIGLPTISRAQSQQDSVECSVLIDKLIRYAKGFIGTPYQWGSDGPDSFDCSGYVHYIFHAIGYEVKRNSKQLSETGIKVNLREIKKGDLVFFVSGVFPDRDITHVGIAITDYENNNFRFIHANKTDGKVSINEYRETRFYNSYGGARRIIPCQ